MPIREIGRGTLMSNNVNSVLEEKLIYVHLFYDIKKIEESNKSFEMILTLLEIKPSGFGSKDKLF